MIRLTLININPAEVKYYPFINISNKCVRSCNVLSPKICIPKETKDINVKAFNMITNKDEAKAMTEHISCDCKCKFNSTTYNSNQKWNNKTCQCQCKNYHKYKEGYSWNPSIIISEISKCLKSIADNSVTECDEIIIARDIVATKKKNTSSTALINYHSRKVRDCYIFHAVLLVIILLLKNIIICCYYAKQKSAI